MIEKISNHEEVSDILSSHFKDYLKSNDPYENIVVYKSKEIVGVISYSIIYERAEINYLLVLKDYRNKGIGSKLLDFALEDMLKNDCTVVTLEVKESNKNAINLYSKYGFKEITKRENYYKNEDGILMSKELR